MPIRYEIKDILIGVTLVALFLGFVRDEPKGVIWALAMFSVASLGGLVLLANTATKLVGEISEAWHQKSLKPFIDRQLWKRIILDLTTGLLLVVSVVTANYAIAEGSQVNPILFVFPAFAGYLAWRIIWQTPKSNAESRSDERI